MARDERKRARLNRKLSVGGYDFYSLNDGNGDRAITDLMIPAGTRIRFIEAS